MKKHPDTSYLKDEKTRLAVANNILELEEGADTELDKEKVGDMIKDLKKIMVSIILVNEGEYAAKEHVKNNLAKGEVGYWNFCPDSGNIAYQDEDGVHMIDPKSCIDNSGIIIK